MSSHPLPWEIIHAIHEHLHNDHCFRDLRTCLFVNHQFWSSSRLLLRHTAVIRTRRRFRRFLATLRDALIQPPLAHIIKALEFDNIGLTLDELVELGALLPNIERIEFDARAWANLIPSADFFLVWPNLTTVGDISRPQVLETLCKTHSVRLTRLSVSSNTIQFINDLPTLVPNLRSLTIHYDYGRHPWTLTPSFLNHLEHHCPFLESLCVAFCAVECIDHIDFENHPRNTTLHELTFTPMDISARWVVYIAHRYPELRRFNLTIPPSAPTHGDQAWQSALAEVAQRCPRLERFRYSNSWLTHNIGPKGLFFEHLVNAAHAIGVEPALRDLQLAYIQSFNDDDLFVLAITVGPSLTKLDLSSLGRLTSSALMASLEHCEALRELTIGGTVAGGNEFEFMPEVVVNACPRLRVLILKRLTIVMEALGSAEEVEEGMDLQMGIISQVRPPMLEELWLHSVRFPQSFPDFLARAEHLHTLVMNDSGLMQVTDIPENDDIAPAQRTISLRLQGRVLESVSILDPFVEMYKNHRKDPDDSDEAGNTEEHVRLTHYKNEIGLKLVETERWDGGAENAENGDWDERLYVQRVPLWPQRVTGPLGGLVVALECKRVHNVLFQKHVLKGVPLQ